MGVQARGVSKPTFQYDESVMMMKTAVPHPHGVTLLLYLSLSPLTLTPHLSSSSLTPSRSLGAFLVAVVASPRRWLRSLLSSPVVALVLAAAQRRSCQAAAGMPLI